MGKWRLAVLSFSNLKSELNPFKLKQKAAFHSLCCSPSFRNVLSRCVTPQAIQQQSSSETEGEGGNTADASSEEEGDRVEEDGKGKRRNEKAGSKRKKSYSSKVPGPLRLLSLPGMRVRGRFRLFLTHSRVRRGSWLRGALPWRRGSRGELDRRLPGRAAGPRLWGWLGPQTLPRPLVEEDGSSVQGGRQLCVLR